MPVAQAAALLALFTDVRLSPATVRRQTEAAGAVAVARETAAVDRILREYPASPPGPAPRVFSAAGAMVPLRQGEWAEVRTLAVTVGRLVLSEIYRAAWLRESKNVILPNAIAVNG